MLSGFSNSFHSRVHWSVCATRQDKVHLSVNSHRWASSNISCEMTEFKSHYSSLKVPAPHEMCSCPYNPAHQVEHYRMHVHLQKCRKQYPNSKKVSCPFDHTHIIHEAEEDFHIQSCPKRYIFNNQVYVVNDDHRPVVPVVSAPVNIPTEEIWEEVAESYKPDPLKKPGIITKIKGATPSERRKHRMASIQNFKPAGGDEPQGSG